MKKILLFLSVTFCAVLFAAAQGWNAVGSPGISAGSETYNSFAINAGGKPYLAYKDNFNSGKASVLSYDGTSWSNVGSPAFTAGSCNYTSMAIDAHGTPYVAYQDAGNGNGASVMKYDGSAWVQVGSANFSAGQANYTRIAIDGSGTPYVIYESALNTPQYASVQKFDGTNWVAVGNAQVSSGSVVFTSIAIDGNGTPYVAFIDGANSNQATVMKFDGTNWVLVGTAGFSGGGFTAGYLSIAIDGNGTPYVAFADGNYSNKVTVMNYTAGSWSVVGSAGFSAGGSCQWVSLAIDAGGTPYVSYKDGGNSAKETVMKFDGSNWVNVGSAGFSAAAVTYTSIAIDASGSAYVGYTDASVSNKATVMKFANTWTGNASTTWTDGGNWSSGTAPAGCSDNAIIPSGLSVYPALSAAASVGTLTVLDGASIDLSGNNLSVCGNLVGGSISAGNLTGGTVELTGNLPQNLTGALYIDNLETINDAVNGVTSAGNVSISQSLVLASSNFTNNGNLTLLSNPGDDAYLDDFTYQGYAYNGNLTVQRYIPTSYLGYYDISSPVSSTVGDLANSIAIRGQNGVDCWYTYNPYPNVQIYNEQMPVLTTGAYYERWVSYTGLSNPLSPMQGIAIRVDQSSDLHHNPITLTGTPNTGTLSPVGITSSTTGNGKGWNFVGNPYPSPISWSAVQHLNASLTGPYYVFKTTGLYSSNPAVNWGAHNGVTGVNGATDAIAVGQGFFVHVSSSTALHMDNTVRTTAAASYYRGPSHLLDNEVRLVLSAEGNSDEIVTYTDPQATNGYDQAVDAVKMPAGSFVSIAYSLDGNDYAINVMNNLNEQTILPLTILAQDSGTYTLTATALNVAGLTAYLQDALNNTLFNLTTGPAQLVLNGGQIYTGRYSIVFKANTTGVVNLAQDITTVYSYANHVTVQRQHTDPATIEVSNILGQNIAEFNSHNDKIEFDLPVATPWYAIVKVTEDKKVTVSKILISK